MLRIKLYTKTNSSGTLEKRKEQDMDVIDPTGIAIKYNNVAPAEPCAICGRVVKQDVGPALFLASTYDQVCLPCGEQYAPELADMLKAWRKTKE